MSSTSKLQLDRKGLAHVFTGHPSMFGIMFTDKVPTEYRDWANSDHELYDAIEHELGRALDTAFDQVMALPNLVRLFGEQATANPVQPFARHFAEQTRHILATLPAADNPYLAQLFRG